MGETFQELLAFRAVLDVVLDGRVRPSPTASVPSERSSPLVGTGRHDLSPFQSADLGGNLPLLATRLPSSQSIRATRTLAAYTAVCVIPRVLAVRSTVQSQTATSQNASHVCGLTLALTVTWTCSACSSRKQSQQVANFSSSSVWVVSIAIRASQRSVTPSRSSRLSQTDQRCPCRKKSRTRDAQAA